MQWLNPPPEFTVEDDRITIRTAPQTDFWRITHDGGVRDTGHFYYTTVTGNFSARVCFGGEYHDQYDQAGLMVRLDETTWLKAGVEFTEGRQHASVVVTRGYSDWSFVPLFDRPPNFWLRVTRQDATFEVHYSLDGSAYIMLRQAYLTEKPTVHVGVMGASPLGGGFRTIFKGFAIRT